jgi:hypothetical protein
VPRETTCPSCGNVLSVPESVTKRWLTCPRCLASVGNPHVLLPPEGVTPAPPPPRPVRWAADADDEAVGDTKSVGLILVVLGLVGAVGLGLVLYGGSAGGGSWSDTKHIAAGAFFAAFLLLGLVVAGMSISAIGRRVVGRVLAIALGVTAILLLVGVFLLSAFLYSVASCFEGCDPKGGRPAAAPAPPASGKVKMKGP